MKKCIIFTTHNRVTVYSRMTPLRRVTHYASVNEEACLQDFLVILKQMLQNYLKIWKLSFITDSRVCDLLLRFPSISSSTPIVHNCCTFLHHLRVILNNLHSIKSLSQYYENSIDRLYHCRKMN